MSGPYIDVFPYHGKHVELKLKDGQTVTGWATYCVRAIDEGSDSDLIALFPTRPEDDPYHLRTGHGYYAEDIEAIREI